MCAAYAKRELGSCRATLASRRPIPEVNKLRNRTNSLIAVAAFTLFSNSASADVVDVPYTGTYNEATGAEAAGDYDNIGGLLDVGVFDLVVGNNVFIGSIKTPNDSSDFFAIRISPGDTLVGATLTWGTNLDDFHPLFARPGPIWTLEESDDTPTIFLFSTLSPNGSSAPQTFVAPSFNRGEGVYGMTIGNGTFARSDNAPVGYSMTFIVEGPMSSVPEPGTLALLGLGFAGLAWRRRQQ